MGKRNCSTNILSQAGQSTIEYILVLAVIVSVALVILKSPLFEGILEADGSIVQAMKQKMEFSYRHGFDQNNQNFVVPNYNTYNHPSYFFSGQTRFFSAVEGYP